MYISLVYARPYKGLFAFAYLPLHVYLTFGTSIDLSCSFVTWYQSHVRSRLHRRTPQLVLSRPPAALAAGEIQRCSSAQRCSPPLFHAAPLPSVAAPNPAASPQIRLPPLCCCLDSDGNRQKSAASAPIRPPLLRFGPPALQFLPPAAAWDPAPLPALCYPKFLVLHCCCCCLRPILFWLVRVLLLIKGDTEVV